MKSILTSIIKKQRAGEKGIFDVSVSEQKRFIDSLPQPSNCIERSYNQYLCQSFFRSELKVFCLNILGFVGYPIFLILALLKRNRGLVVKLDAVGNFKTLPEIIPDSLKEEYDIDINRWGYNYSVKIKDLRFLWKLFIAHPFSSYYQFKCLMNIARYSKMISDYQPRAIVGHSEFSFTSSVLTDYCRFCGVKHINVMHGEKLFYIRDSFFSYDKCYVWHEHYQNLFTQLRADSDQFTIEVPKSLRFKTEDYIDDMLKVDFTYYLADESELEIESIVQSMEVLKRKGYTIRYRPHPTYTNISTLAKFVEDKEVEINKEFSILSSISNTDNAVGSYSTTLLQAYFAGKKVILNDITFPDRYIKLKNMNYILAITDNCETLSNKLNKDENKRLN